MAMCRFRWHTPSKYFFLLLLQTVFLVSAATYKTYYFDEICNEDSEKEIELDASGSGSSAIFEISRNPGYKNDIECEIIVKPPPPYGSSGDDKSSNEEKSRSQKLAEASSSYGIVLSVEEINLRKEEFLPSCKDVLRVSLKKHNKWTTQMVGCWRNLTSQSVASLTKGYSAELKVEFKSGNFWPAASREYNLNLTITAFALKFSQDCPQALPDNTRAEWFACVKRDWCIWQGLTCDHRNNCGDGSDEWKDGQAHCDTNINGGIIGLSVGLGLVAFIAVFVIVCCIRKRKKRNRVNDSTPTAPLLVAIEENNQRIESCSYGSTHDDPQPPPYDYQTPYPPPPPYKE